MAAVLCRSGVKLKYFLKLNLLETKCIKMKEIHSSAISQVKEIQHHAKDKVTIIEGVQVKSPREGQVISPPNNPKACPLCRLGLVNLKYTDVLITSQFIDSKGQVLNQTITGLCGRQHWKIVRLVRNAQMAGLLPRSDDELPPYDWEKNNRYFMKVREIKHMDNKQLVADKKKIPIT